MSEAESSASRDLTFRQFAGYWCALQATEQNVKRNDEPGNAYGGAAGWSSMKWSKIPNATSFLNTAMSPFGSSFDFFVYFHPKFELSNVDLAFSYNSLHLVQRVVIY